jgi:hypothetical protein
VLRRLGWPLVIFGECFAVLAVFRFRSPGIDAFVSLVGGREVAEHGLPHHDRLTLLGHGRRWIDQQWLAQWVLYRAWDLGGYRLMALLGTLFAAAAFGLLAHVLLERGAAPRRMVKWTLLAFAVSLPDQALRAQDFAYPLFVLVGWVLLRDLGAQRLSARRLVVAIALLVLWANVHASVILGLRARRRVLHMARPRPRPARVRPRSRRRSPRPALHTVRPRDRPLLRGLPRQRRDPALLVRVGSPRPTSTACRRSRSSCSLALLDLLVRRRLPAPWPLLVATTALVALGFAGLRWECWAGFAGVVLATDVLNAAAPATPEERARRPRRFEVALGLLAVPALVVLLVQTTAGFEGIAPRASIAAVARYAAAHPRATILADDRTATPLLWLHPELAGRLALDDRLEVFRPSVVDEWADFVDGKPAVVRRLASRYAVLVASWSNGTLRRRLLGLHARVVHDGRDGVVVARGSG